MVNSKIFIVYFAFAIQSRVQVRQYLRDLQLQIILSVLLMEAKRSQYADEQLQEMMHSLRKEDPKIVCPQGKKVTKVCVNQQCANALRCSDSHCQSCGKDIHIGCIVNSSLQDITEMVNERIEGCRQILAKILRIEEEFINNIRKTRKLFVKKYLIGAGMEQGAQLVRKIYGERRYNALSGREASKMFKDLQETVIKEQKAEKEIIEWYADSLHKKNEEIEEMRKIIGNGGQFTWFGSTNMISKLTEQQIQFIANSLNKPKKLQLLFRASEHQFKVAAFHKYCDGIEDTFVIARTNFGKTIAGFSHYKWESTEKDVYDQAKNAFLLQIDLMQKMTHEKGTLICCRANYGPLFGGTDFGIYDNCNTTTNLAHFPASYNIQSPNKYTQCEQTYRLFTGAANQFNFLIVEYEVFRVIF